MNRLIFETIKSDLQAFVPSLKIVLNNESYSPAIRETYLRVFLEPSQTRQQSYGEDRQISFEGFFTVEVNQFSGVNENVLVDSLVERYLKINTINNVWILNCIRQPSTIEDGRIRTNIRINYQGVRQ